MTYTSSVDSIIRTMYATISGPAGVERDWEMMRTLYHPRAHLIRTGIDDDGRATALLMGVDTYIKNVTPLFRDQPFFEVEVARRTDQFGNIAHVLSTYEARREQNNGEPVKRGINSIQLYNDGERWWIMNMIWDNEREDNPLPEKYYG